ncbi:MAG: hypothetical protein JRN54_10435 [Nitrososphaerota archaeon]|nr:hypothetical protein [Nitrososphaerota archaeon]MDG6971503.1 hypothetical protein [Nitrososphaerota archaeon]MDG6980005.1 hypothetical protein [Nitrososphaerota archaeon]
MMTSDARAYYALVTRLRRAGLPFSSLVPESNLNGCEVILTTALEAKQFGQKVLTLEAVDDNPGVFKGQVLSHLDTSRDTILAGVDPGKRNGLAVFYGQRRLALSTLESAASVCMRIGAFGRGIPESRLLVRIGNGNRSMAMKLVELLKKEVPRATIEVVDESGTSTGSSKIRGAQRDQAAAAKIAFRKGEVVSSTPTRIRG